MVNMPLGDLILRNRFMERIKEAKRDMKEKGKKAPSSTPPTGVLNGEPKQQKARLAPQVQVGIDVCICISLSTSIGGPYLS